MMPKLKTCNFRLTNLCKFKSSPCATNISDYSMCKKEDVEASNKANHNPNPNDGKYEKILELGENGKPKSKILFYVIIAIVVSIGLCCVVFCCENYDRSSKPKTKPQAAHRPVLVPVPVPVPINNNNNSNNNNNNNNNNNEPDDDYDIYDEAIERMKLNPAPATPVNTQIPQPVSVPQPGYSQAYAIPVQPVGYYPPPEAQVYAVPSQPVPEAQAYAVPSQPPAYSPNDPSAAYSQYSQQPVYVQQPYDYASYPQQPPNGPN